MKKLEKITAGQDFERRLFFSAGDLPDNQVLVSRQLLFESDTFIHHTDIISRSSSQVAYICMYL
jgi:hypothetical protein